ncbi:MAG: hypothetical protein KDD40_11090, partial [Bdellovibrionales bacterium]|nr:hypothetical protein [Bdellovibrionales bacterium]
LNAMWVLAKLNEAYKLSGPTFFDQASGYYVTLVYDLPLTHNSGDGWHLPLFIRYSAYDLHEKVSILGQRDLSLNRTRTTLGINLRKGKNLAYKWNYQWQENALGEKNDLNEFAAQLSF